MPTRIVKPYKRGQRKYTVRGYEQKYKKPRGPPPKIKKFRSTKEKKTYWLMDRYGKFTGRAGPEGKTTSKRHTKGGIDSTKNVVGKLGRIYGRAGSDSRKYNRRK